MVSIVESSNAQQQRAADVPQQAEHEPNAPAGGDSAKRTATSKSAVSQRSIELKITTPKAATTTTDTELAKRALKLDLVNTTTTTRNIDEFNIKSPKSPLATTARTGRLPHQKSLTAQVDLVEDRKTLRDALYQGIFHRHRRTIFAVGSFLRMLRSRNSQYNTIRSSSEGEDIDETR